MVVNQKEKKITEQPIEVFAETIVKMAEEDERIVVISTDSYKSGGAAEFKKRFPDRFFEFGICEQNAASAAAGLAWSGFKPFWTAISTFATMRCFEQIRNDIVRPILNVVICGRAAGLSYSMQGPTHVSIDEIGILRSLPKMTVVVPADGLDVRNIMYQSIKLNGPVYFRKQKLQLTRVNPENYKFEIGKGVLLKGGRDISIIACGTMVFMALETSEILEKEGISSEVINMHTLKPVDEEMILKTAKKTGLVITMEEHSIINGLGSAVADVLSQNCPTKLIKFGFNDEWPVDGPVWSEVMDYHGLSAIKIADKLKNILKKI
jgi:transketolase